MVEIFLPAINLDRLVKRSSKSLNCPQVRDQMKVTDRWVGLIWLSLEPNRQSP